jgi:hypothetical protein
MPKFRVAFEETTERIAIVYAPDADAATRAVENRQEDDNYENPAPAKSRTIFSTEPLPECDC